MADGVEIGHGFISISASARDAVRQVERDFSGAMPKVGQKAGHGLSGGFLAAAGKIAGPLAALFATAVALLWLASTVYRRALLITGHRVHFREVLRGGPAS